MKKQIIFYPIIFAGIPALSLYVNNIGLVRFEDFIQTLTIMFGVGAFLWFLVNLVIKDIHKSALLVTILVILFYSFGHIFTSANYLLSQAGWGAPSLFQNESGQNWLLVSFIILLCTVIILIKKTTTDFSMLSIYFNIFSTILVVITFANFFLLNGFTTKNPTRQFANLWRQSSLTELQELQFLVPGNNHETSDIPDIYYIILDGYGRSDVLKDIYKLDNSDFINFLEDKGFYVAEMSTANYNFTLLSLSSSMNFMYLNPVVEIVGTQTAYTFPLELTIEDSRLFRLLRGFGYQIVAFSTGYDATNINTADVFLSPHTFQLNAFHGELIANTPLPLILQWFSFKNQYDIHRENILFILDHLPETVSISSPKFVFAHILAPHPPFVFGRHGESIQPARPFSISDGDMLILGEGQKEYHQYYRNQTLFITDRIQIIIAEILATSTSPPIIIVQSDHGPGSMLSYSGPDLSNLYERMSILTAYYFPDEDYRLFYDTITPVNSFRIILDMYFGTNFGLIEDRNYFVRGDQLYKFADITDHIEPYLENE